MVTVGCFWTGTESYKPDSLSLNVMFATHDNFFDDSKICEIDETKRLFSARRFVGTFDCSDDFSKS
jgi:hypothetical protein